MSLTVTEQPAREPIYFDATDAGADYTGITAKSHLNIDNDITRHDGNIRAYLAAARIYAEETYGWSYITRTYTLHEKAATQFELLRPPLQSITSVASVASDGTETELTTDAYTVDTTTPVPVLNITNLPGDADTIKIVYVAGYGDNPEDVPEPARLGMLLLLSQWFTHRSPLGTVQEQPIKYAVDALLGYNRMNWGVM